MKTKYHVKEDGSWGVCVAQEGGCPLGQHYDTKEKAEAASEEIMERIYQKASQTKLKDWYMENFPTDDMGEDIAENKTFLDLFHDLDAGKDVYDEIKVDDSIVRERLFEKLSKIMKVDYDYIYNQWLHGGQEKREDIDPDMIEVVRCKQCGQGEYYGSIHWLNGKTMCRKCIYELWQEMNGRWKPGKKDYVFPVYSDGVNYTSKNE